MRLAERTGLVGLALLALGMLVSMQAAHAQQKSLSEQIVGTWTYVSADTVSADGTRVPLFGPDPQGMATFDAAGHYILLTMRRGIPRFASTNRNEGTAEENRAVVQGSSAHFGTYTVNEAERTITFNIQTATFPNWNGTVQKRPVSIDGDQLKWTTPASTGSGTAEVVLRRAR
jgi:hypothetical protein